MRYLIVLVIGGHGLHLLHLWADPLKGWRGTSWLLGSAITGDRLKSLAFGLSLVAGIATLGCGVAVAFSGSFHALWRPLAMIGAVFGVVFFAIFWDGQTRRLVSQGVIGVAISALLFLSAVLFPHVFG